jgi:hypothetical protein
MVEKDENEKERSLAEPGAAGPSALADCSHGRVSACGNNSPRVSEGPFPPGAARREQREYATVQIVFYSK